MLSSLPPAALFSLVAVSRPLGAINLPAYKSHSGEEECGVLFIHLLLAVKLPVSDLCVKSVGISDRIQTEIRLGDYIRVEI